MPSFTDDELLQMTVLAEQRIDVGIWDRLSRETGDDYDRVLIWLPVGREAHYKIERDPSGWTYLLWCAADGWRLLISGTFEECLGVFRISTH